MNKLRIGVEKLTSCSGCINEIIYALLADPKLTESLEIAYFPELLDKKSLEGQFDIFFVEGSIVNKDQIETVEDIRERSRFVIAVGTCSTYGGIQSLRDKKGVEEVKKHVYPKPELIDVEGDVYSLQEVIKTDLAIPGCPVDGNLLLRVLRKIAIGSKDISITESLCAECKRKGLECVLVKKKIPCLGPITAAGCGAICPSFGRGCIGCFGLRKDISSKEIENFANRLEETGIMKKSDVLSFVMRFSYAKEKGYFEKIVEERGR
jgi:coenzyme F420-reducing hydrogenase gamma subunit